jgi:hypothetical protein
MARTYTRDEVQAILGKALEQQHADGDALSHDDLLAIGRELGIERAALEAAAAGMQGDAEMRREVERRIRAAHRGFAWHFLTYALVIALLATINLMTGGPLWFVWAALGWGVGLGLHAMAAFTGDRHALEERVKRRLERKRAREEKQREKEERRRRAGALGRSAKRFSEVAMGRIAEALDSAAVALEEDRAAARPAGDGKGVRVDDAKRARVGATDDEELEREESTAERARRRA